MNGERVQDREHKESHGKKACILARTHIQKWSVGARAYIYIYLYLVLSQNGRMGGIRTKQSLGRIDMDEWWPMVCYPCVFCMWQRVRAKRNDFPPTILWCTFVRRSKTTSHTLVFATLKTAVQSAFEMPRFLRQCSL